MSQNTIILAMSSYNDFTEEIKAHLEYHKFNVTFINSTSNELKDAIDNHFRYPQFSDYIIHQFRKIFFFDHSYKKQLKQKLYFQKLQKRIETTLANQHFDYTLVIRPDLFSIPILQLLRSRTKIKTIGYQWNGMKRFPKTLDTIPYFDRFYIFDPNDLNDPLFEKYQLNLISNFYFDMYKPKPIAHQGIIAYFVGLHFDSRREYIDYCAKVLSDNGIDLDFNIKLRSSEKSKRNNYFSNNIHFIPENISFKDNLEHINRADILVDIVNPIHQGLSFRVFEALYYEKKLITNNPQVIHYDFYHPNNILVCHHKEDLNQIMAFIKQPYVSIDPQIVQKYSFSNWIKNILNLPPYQSISPTNNPLT